MTLNEAIAEVERLIRQTKILLAMWADDPNWRRQLESQEIALKALRGIEAMEKMLVASGLEKPWEMCVDVKKDGDQYVCGLHRVTEFATSLIAWERADDLASAAIIAAGKLEGV